MFPLPITDLPEHRRERHAILARSLGRALLALESFPHRHQAAAAPLLTATLIWAAVTIL